MTSSNNNDDKGAQGTVTDDAGDVSPSISVRMIRHAESRNNQVYRNARYIYRGGTPDFDQEGWTQYVETHRSSDPGLSEIGQQQAERLRDFLVPHLVNQASRPVRVVVSPMRRTLETIQPTVRRLEQEISDGSTTIATPSAPPPAKVLVHGFYHESEGCHTHDKAEEGMNPAQIRELLQEGKADSDHLSTTIDFVGFPHPDRGWYSDATGAETRSESEGRAAKFYLWLCEYLDAELAAMGSDVFDAGVAVPGEEHENEHDKHAQRQRRRRTCLLVGHGDFMSLVLKRIVAGFGHAVETEGIPHRSAFVHFNTGISELEYFGNGRFLVMTHNQTPHLRAEEYATLRGGGSLKDGWSYLMPNDKFVLDAEVSVAFADELAGHEVEQTEALKSLYLSSHDTEKLHHHDTDQSLSVVEQDKDKNEESPSAASRQENKKLFIVKRGLQVVGVATYAEDTGRLTDVAVRPSVGEQVSEALFNAVKEHSRKLGRSGSLLVMPRSDESKNLFEAMGFTEVENEDSNNKGFSSTPVEMELKH